MSKSTSNKKIDTMNETVTVPKKSTKKVPDTDDEATVSKKVTAKKAPETDGEPNMPKKVTAKKVPEPDGEPSVMKKSAKKVPDSEDDVTVPKKSAKKVPDSEDDVTVPKKVAVKKAPTKKENVATNKVTASTDMVTTENMTDYHVLLEKWVNIETEIQKLQSMIEPLEHNRDQVVSELRKVMHSAKMPETENVLEDNVDPVKKCLNVPNEYKSGVKMPEASKKVVSTLCKKKPTSNQKLEENSEESEIILPKVVVDSDSSQSDLESLSSCSSDSESECSADDAD